MINSFERTQSKENDFGNCFIDSADEKLKKMSNEKPSFNHHFNEKLMQRPRNRQQNIKSISKENADQNDRTMHSLNDKCHLFHFVASFHLLYWYIRTVESAMCWFLYYIDIIFIFFLVLSFKLGKRQTWNVCV